MFKVNIYIDLKECCRPQSTHNREYIVITALSSVYTTCPLRATQVSPPFYAQKKSFHYFAFRARKLFTVSKSFRRLI